MLAQKQLILVATRDWRLARHEANSYMDRHHMEGACFNRSAMKIEHGISTVLFRYFESEADLEKVRGLRFDEIRPVGPPLSDSVLIGLHSRMKPTVRES